MLCLFVLPKKIFIINQLFHSNQICAVSLVSSNDYYKQQNGVVCERGNVGVNFQVGLCVQKELVVG